MWNQPVIVDNRPGAGSTVGTIAFVRSVPDGYTLLVGANPLAIAPVVYPNLPYDPRRDLVPISLIGTSPEVLVVNPALGVDTVAELIALAKKGPRKFNYGSAGLGTVTHLTSETFNRHAGLGAVHIPFRGGAMPLVDLLASRVDWVFDSPGAILSYVRTGKLRALGVSAAQRSPQLPDVPTLAEVGFPKVDFQVWVGLVAPAGTPEPILRRIESSIGQALSDPGLRATFATLGWEVPSASSRDFAALLEIELVRLGDAAREAGVKAD